MTLDQSQSHRADTDTGITTSTTRKVLKFNLHTGLEEEVEVEDRYVVRPES